MSDLARNVKKIMADVERRTLLSIGRGVFSRLTKSEGMHQAQIEGLAGETIETDRPQPFGFKTSPIGGDAIFVCVGGNRDHALVIMIDDRSCPVSLGAGETCVYNANGDYVHFKVAGEIEVSAKQNITLKAPEKVRIESPLLEITGQIIDNCDTNSKTMQAMRQTYDTHDHVETNSVTRTPQQKMGG